MQAGRSAIALAIAVSDIDKAIISAGRDIYLARNVYGYWYFEVLLTIIQVPTLKSW